MMRGGENTKAESTPEPNERPDKGAGKRTTTEWLRSVRRIWHAAAWGFALLCALLWANEVLDIPHVLLGALQTPVNWHDASIETALVLVVGVITTLVLIRNINKHKQAEQRIVHLNQVLRAIRDVNQLITVERDRDRLLQGACDVLTTGRGYHSVWIALFDEDGSFDVGFEAGLGESFASLCKAPESGELPHCMRDVLAKFEVITVEHTAATRRDCPLAEVYPGAAVMATRLEQGGKVYGLLSVSLPGEMADSEEEQSLFAALAADIALGLNAITAEAERAQLLYDLQKRIKELECIRGVAAAIDRGEGIAETLQRAVELLPAGWQYPESRAAARRLAVPRDCAGQDRPRQSGIPL